MKFLRVFFLTGICCFAFARIVLAADNTVDRVYAVPGHGQLHLKLLKGWSDELRTQPGKSPPSVFISGFEGSPFVVYVTPRWPDPHNAGDFGTPKSIHAMVAKAAHVAESESVEGKLSIVTMGGAQGPGYYFDATDRAPKPGEFKYMTLGAVGVGNVICTFTILTNDKNSPVKNEAFTMLRHAGWRPAH